MGEVAALSTIDTKAADMKEIEVESVKSDESREMIAPTATGEAFVENISMKSIGSVAQLKEGEAVTKAALLGTIETKTAEKDVDVESVEVEASKDMVAPTGTGNVSVKSISMRSATRDNSIESSGFENLSIVALDGRNTPNSSLSNTTLNVAGISQIKRLRSHESFANNFREETTELLGAVSTLCKSISNNQHNNDTSFVGRKRTTGEIMIDLREAQFFKLEAEKKFMNKKKRLSRKALSIKEMKYMLKEEMASVAIHRRNVRNLEIELIGGKDPMIELDAIFLEELDSDEYEE